MAPGSTPTSAQTFPAMEFRKKWRTYQSRVLDNLDSYLDDRRFHLAAAPGSGKTILGLEIVRRLNQRAVVLAPTITIRDQWIARLLDCFLPAGQPCPAWISADLRTPAVFTVATYQALHKLICNDNDNENEDEANSAHAHDHDDREPAHILIPEFITSFETLVVDEAHHLRAEWWKTLTAFVRKLKQPTIVALTATPPYDVSDQEWHRYEQLCGPVDTEVSVPELVLEGDLCPHQDYIFFTLPSEKDQTELRDFRSAVGQFFQRLKQNGSLVEAIENHPWLALPEDYARELQEDPQALSSLVIFLRAAGAMVPKKIWRMAGIKSVDLPALDLQWAEVLLTHCLFYELTAHGPYTEVFKEVRHELQEMGAIERRKVRLLRPPSSRKLLTQSPSKLGAIEAILKAEYGSLGPELRCAILTDFIRKTDFSAASEGSQEVGVVPIFEALRAAAISGLHLGVLSGSLVTVPLSAEKGLREAACDLGISNDHITIAPLADGLYANVELCGEYDQGMVRLMTEIFDQGLVNVIIGTKSLLGEGWDAPCINTLILATFVGSYVLSNQMRGRSIRSRPAHAEKTANIWHLVCVEPGADPGEDYELLLRRCRGFVGVGVTSPSIESGNGRLELPTMPISEDQISSINSVSRQRAGDREALRVQWQKALAAAQYRELTQGLRTPRRASTREFVLRSTVGRMLFQAGSTFLSFFLQSLRDPAGPSPADALFFAAAGAALISSPLAALAAWRLLRHGTPEWSIRRIGKVLLDTLQSQGAIARHFATDRKFHVYSQRARDGSVFCWLGGGTGQEQMVFLRALEQLLSPIGTPRYVLARKRILAGFHEDYFAVPDVLGAKKEIAEEFTERWKKMVGPVTLVATHTPDGREILLRARVHSLASTCQTSERMCIWR